VIGRSFAALMVPEPLQKEEEEILAKLRRGERIQQLETLRRRKDGSLVPVSLSLSPIKDTTGRVSGAAKIARDITERKELDQRKDEFLAIASHEIRTPLTASRGFLQLLERHLSKQQDQQGLTYVNRVGNQINRLTRLVADFMDISRIQSGGLVYQEETFDLDGLAREVVETLQQGATSHRIQVEGHTRACIQGDRDRIGQVLGNLLTNAVRYSPAADAVIVRLAADGQSARVSVQDFGPGIAEEEEQKIFERYYRTSGAVDRAPAGLGIGLYLAREIISHHHGTIWVESAIGEGSIFHFSLPTTRQ
jgi:signal transduction histidine kinase